MNITVNVDEVTLATLVTDAWRQIGEEDWEPAQGDTLGGVIAERLIDRILRDTDMRNGLAVRVREIRDEEIRALIIPMIREVVDRPIPRTNTYGEPNGQTTTLTEVVVDEAKAFLTRPIDGYSRDKGTALDVMVRAEVAALFKSTVTEAATAARDAVTREVAAQFQANVATAIRSGLAAGR